MFRLQEKNGVQYYTIDSFDKTGLVKHCFTTRVGGVSKGAYESMNLRLNCDDARENVLRNFEIIGNAIGVRCRDMVLSHQIHEDVVYNAAASDCGNGLMRENALDSADGLMTAARGVALVTFYADCVPLFFLDPVKKVIALSHSGWKGTVKKIGAKTIRQMAEVHGSNPADILTGIGPSIGVCHFEVGGEVAEQFEAVFGKQVLQKFGEKWHVDLQKAVTMQLLEAGILENHITNAGICTYCNSGLLFSHRKTQGRRGSLAAIMELK